MSVESLAEFFRQKRSEKSFAFLAERCPTSDDAPYRIRPAEHLRADEVCVLVLPGSGGRKANLRGCNGILKRVHEFVGKNFAAADNIRTCVAVCEFGKYHLDKLARGGMYCEVSSPEYMNNQKRDMKAEYFAETYSPLYIHDIFSAAVLPRIASADGRRLPQQQALQNIRRLNIVAHCHGGYVAMQLEKLMNEKMSELGYSPAEQKALKSQLMVLRHNPDCPKGVSELYFVGIESAGDRHNEYYNYFREWLLMAPKDFGVCYLPKQWGRTLLCAQVDKAGVEHNPPREYRKVDVNEWFENRGRISEDGEFLLGEHDFMGFTPAQNMSKGARRLQRFADNILYNALKNSLAQKDRFVPLPKIQSLVSRSPRDKCEFARAAIVGFRLEQQLWRTDKSKIDQHANLRRSIPTVELD